MHSAILLSLLLALVAARSDVKKQQQEFNDSNGDITDKMSLFKNKRAFREHTPELFKDMKQLHSKNFFKHARSHNLLEEITADDIEQASAMVCWQLGSYIKHIPPTSFKHIKDGCLKTMMQTIDKDQVKHIPTTLIKKHAKAIVSEKNELFLYKDSQIKVFTGFKDACKGIDPESLRKLSKSQWKQLAPQCFADIPGVDRIDFSKNMIDMPKDIFSYVSFLVQRETYGAMNADHVRLYGSKCRDPKARGQVVVMYLNKKGVAGVSAEMFRKFVKGFHKMRYNTNDKKRSFGLRKLWKHMPKGILAKCRARNELAILAKMLDAEDMKYMKPEQINEMIRENPKVCKYMPSHWKLSKSVVADLKISAKCFANLPKSNQVSLLMTSVKLDENLLGKITYSHAKRWPHGLNFLNKIKAANANELIKNMSRAVKEGRHVCKAIKNVDHLKGLKVFRHIMPKGCWENIGFKIKERDVLKQPLLFAGRKHVLKNLLAKGEKFPGQKLTQNELLRLTKDTGEECSAMGITAFRQINGEKLSGLSPTCIASLPFKKELMPEEIQHMGPKAFSMITKDSVADLKLNWFLNEQLENLSSEIEDLTQLASAAFSITQLNDLTEERLRFLQARLWSPMDASLFSVFKDKQIFSEFPGAKMIYWKPAQVKALPQDILYSLNVDQATQLGAESQDAAGYQQLFDPILLNFEPAVQEVFKTRFACQVKAAGTSAASPSSSLGLMSAAALALISTILIL